MPIILYTGAAGLVGILDVQSMLGLESRQQTLVIIVWVVGVVGASYAVFGGLRTVAVSDVLNGFGLLAGGLMITWFGLNALGSGNVLAGVEALMQGNEGRFSSIEGSDSAVPVGTIFTGVLLLHMFYWTTNQQIIQRTLGARSLEEGQKGVLATGFLKLLGPLYLVIPGMIAFTYFAGQEMHPDQSYGALVNAVLPPALAGFFAAALMGAILSSFNSALNSTCTLFSLGVYKQRMQPNASEESVVMSGKYFGWGIAVFAMVIAPMLAGQESIFAYLQKMNGMYFIPIFAVVLVGMLTSRVPAVAANTALVGGLIVIGCGYFVPPLAAVVDSMNEFHFLAAVFMYLVIYMLIVGSIRPMDQAFLQPDVQAVDLTPWKHLKSVSIALVVIVLVIDVSFAELSAL